MALIAVLKKYSASWLVGGASYAGTIAARDQNNLDMEPWLAVVLAGSA